MGEWKGPLREKRLDRWRRPTVLMGAIGLLASGAIAAPGQRLKPADVIVWTGFPLESAAIDTALGTTDSGRTGAVAPRWIVVKTLVAVRT